MKNIDFGGREHFAFSDLDKANVLNDYFVSISRLDESKSSLPVFTSKTETLLTDINVQESEIIDIIKNLVTNKACGEDQIGHILLIKTCYTVVKP